MRREKATYFAYRSAFDDPIEVANWIYSYLKRKFKTTDICKDDVDELVRTFKKRYEFEHISDAISVLKGLKYSKEVAKKYVISFDTNFGMYNFSIEKREGLSGNKKSDPKSLFNGTAIAITIEKIPDNSSIEELSQGDCTPYKKCQPSRLAHPVGELFFDKETKKRINNLKKLIKNWNIEDTHTFSLTISNNIGAESSADIVESAKNANEISYYLNLPEYSLRIGLHNVNAGNYKGIRNRPKNIAVTLKDMHKKDTFKAKDGVKLEEYVYLYFTKDRLKKIAEAILFLLENGVWNSEIAPADYINPDDKEKIDSKENLKGVFEPTHVYVGDDNEWKDRKVEVFGNNSGRIIKIYYWGNGYNDRISKYVDKNDIIPIKQVEPTQQPTEAGTFPFAQHLQKLYAQGEKLDWLKAKKIAKDFNIETETEIMQACELAVVLTAREIAQNGNSIRQQYEEMKDLYERQVTIRPLDTKSRVLQQYSTPCPFGYLLGRFVNKNDRFWNGKILEPSAGNGLLTIAFPPQQVCVNELDEIRVANLKNLGFSSVTNQNASSDLDLAIFPDKSFRGVITNPPFAKLTEKDKIERHGWQINTLDYKMAVLALDKMHNDGKAAVIVGGKLWNAYWKPLSERSEKKVLFGQWKTFLGYLYAQYNVVDVIYIDGDHIYQKQGTTYPIVVILIDGRHEYDESNKPRYVFDPYQDTILTTFDQLFDRLYPFIETKQDNSDDKRKKAKALMLKMKMIKIKL